MKPTVYRSWLAGIAFAISSQSLFAAPLTQQLGLINNRTDLTESIIHRSAWPSSFIQTESALNEMDVIFIDLSSELTPDALALANHAYQQGKILLLDSSQVLDPQLTSERVSDILGVGLTDTLVIARKGASGSPEFKVISVAEGVTSQNVNAILAKAALDSLTPWIQPKTNRRVRRSANSQQDAYKPETSIPIEFRRVGFQCRVGDDFQGNGFTNNADWNSTIDDACNGDASVSLFYTLDFIRSVPYSGGGSHNADNSKFVRITYDPNTSGGAGWHLVDKPTHKHTWFESWANRISWYGPIAMKYGVEIQSTDPSVRLFHSTPNNVGLEQEIREVSGITVGVDAGVKAEVGDKEPTVGADIKGNFSYNSQRWVTYKTHEYEVQNLSTVDRARWKWDRNFEQRSENWRSKNIAAIWDSSWFFKDSAFSPAAYANYKPGFSATYRVDGDRSGTSDFLIENQVTVAALSGRVQYSGVWSSFTPWAYNGSEYRFQKRLRVNWDAPVFQPEANVSIEAYAQSSFQGLCLTAAGDYEGAAVSAGDCHYQNSQLWGLDRYQQYKSRIGDNKCLTLEGNGNLSVRTCNNSAQQKWAWSGDQLKNATGTEVVLNRGQVTTSRTPGYYNQWRSYVRNIHPDRVMTSF